jgi:predicted nucleic acid-binding Zn ribbon protein
MARRGDGIYLRLATASGERNEPTSLLASPSSGYRGPIQHHVAVRLVLAPADAVALPAVSGRLPGSFAQRPVPPLRLPPGRMTTLRHCSSSRTRREPKTMPRAPSRGSTRSEAARALVVGAERECPGCGTPLTDQQRACSGRCRVKLRRQRKADELRVLVQAAQQAIEALERTLSDTTRGGQ